MIKLTDNHGARLVRMSPARILPALGDELQNGAQSIVDTVRHNMNDGAISGSGHIPGAPGDFAKSDTHEMERSLHVGTLAETPTSVSTTAGAGAEHSLYVELGTSKAAPRPGVQLAVTEVRPRVVEALGRRYIEEVNR